MTFTAFVATVEAFTGRPARHGQRGVMLACPAHDDSRESLSVSQGAGKILVYDFGGCRVQEIIAALGLRMADLFETPRPKLQTQHPCSPEDAMRSATIDVAVRQGWARPGVLELYEAADAMRWADRVRRLQTEDSRGAWDTLTAAAATTTAAEDLWAWAVEAELCGR